MPGIPLETLGPLIVYCFVSLVTPGPNNVMLMASGVNFGFWRTRWHILGVCIGFMILVACIGFGLGAVVETVPGARLALKIVGGSYLLYLAWKIAMTRTMAEAGESTGKPMSFLGAVAFQWVNVKGWMMGITVNSLYADPSDPISVLAVAFTFGLLGLSSSSIWTAFGVTLREVLSDPVRLKWFNIAMGVALALTIIPMVL